jgi:hypothetical protein
MNSLGGEERASSNNVYTTSILHGAVFLEKLTVSQLIKKLYAFYGT